MLPHALDEDEVAAAGSRCHTGRARPSEGVEDDVAWLGERFDQRCDPHDGLLIRMKLVVRVLPWQDIAQRPEWIRRPPLSEEESNFVMALCIAIARAVGFHPHEMAH